MRRPDLRLLRLSRSGESLHRQRFVLCTRHDTDRCVHPLFLRPPGSADYFPLYIVAFAKEGKSKAIYYLSADLQEPEIFEPRKPLSATAKRAGWQGFNYRLTHIRNRLVRLS